MKRIKQLSGFTIVEMLVVISIISILMTLSLIGSNTVRLRARDSSRKSDLAKAQGALILYYADKKTYPLPCLGSSTAFPCYYNGKVGGYDLMMNGRVDLVESANNFKGLKGDGYTDVAIQDEKFSTGIAEGFAYRYRPSEDGLDFELSAKLENGGDGDLKKDASGAGSDDFRYERGTDKSIRTGDCVQVSGSGSGCTVDDQTVIDEYVNYSLKALPPGLDTALETNWERVVANDGVWTYSFDSTGAKKCEKCRLQ